MNVYIRIHANAYVCTLYGEVTVRMCIRMYEGMLLVLRVEYCMGRRLTGIAS